MAENLKSSLRSLFKIDLAVLTEPAQLVFNASPTIRSSTCSSYRAKSITDNYPDASIADNYRHINLSTSSSVGLIHLEH